jgi:hypothetical protein
MPVVRSRTMKALGIAMALACALLACTTKAPPGDPVQLLTGTMPFGADECDGGGNAAVLLVDREYGTALAAYGMFDNDTTRAPVMWPPGFTGRQVGSEVVVVDPEGNIVATTGQSYVFSGNPLIEEPKGGWPNREDRRYRRGWVNSLIGPAMFYACGTARPWPTLTPLPMI